MQTVTVRTIYALLPLLLALLIGCGAPQQQAAPVQRAESTAPAKHKRHRKHGRGGDASGVADPQMRNVTGNFDFYLLSLSWSPGFCATPAGKNDPGQCAPGRRFAFVLHGLWPQYEQHGWPSDCSAEAIDPSAVSKMISIMPSERLIQHEWTKHGTCSGLTSAEYFEEASEAFHAIKIPSQYQQLASQVSVLPDKLRSEFASVNPKLGEQGIVVLCKGSGRYLTEVHACLTKEIQGRPCNREELAQECRSDSIIMRPVR